MSTQAMRPLSQAAITAMNQIQVEVFQDIIHGLNLYEYAIVTRARDVRSWMDGIERKVQQLRLTGREESYVMDQLARAIGIDPKPYDYRPYYDFLEAVWNGLQGIDPTTIQVERAN